MSHRLLTIASLIALCACSGADPGAPPVEDDAIDDTWGDENVDETRAVYGRRGRGPFPVGGRPRGASSDGIQDLVGNVWEWCSDRYHVDSYARLPLRDPVLEVADPQAKAVKRGGSWTNAASSIRCSKRGAERLHVRRPNLGFRCVTG